MLCRSPFIRDPSGRVFKTFDKDEYYKGVPFPCGQCLACRINRRRVWTLRLVLEGLSHPFSSFVTLTYSPDGLFRNESGFCDLSKRDVQLYLKRLRKAVSPLKIRYFVCGEYGSKGQRPHYHLIIFGLNPHYSSHVQAMTNAWNDSDLGGPLGHVMIGECTHESMQYVAGYVVKKFVTKKDSKKRSPEFTLSSRKPGLGYTSILELAKILEKPNAKKWFNIMDNGLPGSISVNGRSLPLGRYLLGKLKDLLWIDETPGVDSYLSSLAIKFLHSNDSFNDENAVFGRLAVALMAEDEQKEKEIRGRHKLFNRRNKL